MVDDGDHASEPDRTPGSRVLAIACMGLEPHLWPASFLSLVDQGVSVLALSSLPVANARRELGTIDVDIRDWDLPFAVIQTISGTWDAVFIMDSPVVVPDRAFDNALEFIDRDVRISSVSFLSNNAGYLSFPERNRPNGMVISGFSQDSITRQLRASEFPGLPVPIPVPGGGGVLINVSVLRALGGVDPGQNTVEKAVLDFALRAVQRGFRNVLDSQTYCFRPALGHQTDAIVDNYTERVPVAQRYHFFPALYDADRSSTTSALDETVALRRAEVQGLDLIWDGGAIGPYETGTQVAMLAQLASICRHPGVGSLTLYLPGDTVPGYARTVLSNPKIRVRFWGQSQPANPRRADVFHRPFQGRGIVPEDQWGVLARRAAVTIHDLIAYDDGHYHATGLDWLHYRAQLARDCAAADMVVAISQYTRDMIVQERLPIPHDALPVVPNGTDHLRVSIQQESVPDAVLQNGLVASKFILVLGASYAHKNRDMAIRAWQNLRERGHDVELIMAGVVVPGGSTRNEEALVMSGGERPLILADVTTEERNWLLSHAAVVLYPTSAEGFGLIPFEAAVAETPTLYARIGPLEELLPEMPVTASGWSAEELGDGLEVLLTDPDASAQQVMAVLAAVEGLSWDASTEKLVAAYFSSLARPRAGRLDNSIV